MLFCMQKDAVILVLRTVIDCDFYKLVWVSTFWISTYISQIVDFSESDLEVRSIV